MSSDGKLTSDTISETAATVGKPLYKPSGVMMYRVLMQTAIGANAHVDVEAATGDEAALKGLNEFPGGKVMNVSPAPQRPILSPKGKPE